MDADGLNVLIAFIWGSRIVPISSYYNDIQIYIHKKYHHKAFLIQRKNLTSKNPPDDALYVEI